MGKIKWQYFVKREGMPLLLEDILFQVYPFSSPVFKKRDIKVGQDYIKIEPGGYFYFDQDSFSLSGRRVRNYILSHLRSAQKLLPQCLEEGRRIIKFSDKVHRYSIRHKLDWIYIVDSWNKLKEYYQYFVYWMIVPQSADNWLENYLRFKIIRPKLKKYGIEKWHEDEILAVLIKPVRKTFAERAEVELEKLADFVRKNNLSLRGRLVKQRIDKFLEKFGWLKTHFWSGRPYSKNDIESKIKVLLKHERHKKVNVPGFAYLAKYLRLSAKEKKIIRVIQDIVFIRTYRSDVISYSGERLKPFFTKIARKLGVRYTDLMWMLVKEFDQVIARNKVSATLLRELRERQKDNFTYCWIKGKVKIIKHNTTKVSDDIYDGIAVIKGKTAFAGIARGKAKIVLTHKDFIKVKKGDILVTNMTSPAFVNLLKKTAGFITDEGGITCHAAIIARELKKPCIIGTKVATQVLQDGDLVEVDADKGVVRVINQ